MNAFHRKSSGDEQSLCQNVTFGIPHAFLKRMEDRVRQQKGNHLIRLRERLLQEKGRMVAELLQPAKHFKDDAAPAESFRFHKSRFCFADITFIKCGLLFGERHELVFLELVGKVEL